MGADPFRKIVDNVLRISKNDSANNLSLMLLMRAILANDFTKVEMLMSVSPELSDLPLAEGAARKASQDFYFPAIAHYLYAGDTALHAAAAGYRVEIAEHLIKCG